jgi:hypothetical protein
MIPKIDKEFAALIPPVSADEYSHLEKSLLAEGCRDRLVVWGDILIDGHKRLQICEKHKIPYGVVAMDFTDRNEAKIYIIFNQLGRRNLTRGDLSKMALGLESLYIDRANKTPKMSSREGIICNGAESRQRIRGVDSASFGG